MRFPQRTTGEGTTAARGCWETETWAGGSSEDVWRRIWEGQVGL